MCFQGVNWHSQKNHSILVFGLFSIRLLKYQAIEKWLPNGEDALYSRAAVLVNFLHE